MQSKLSFRVDFIGTYLTIVSLSLGIGAVASFGSSPNLLINPSFEEPYNPGFPNYADLPGGSTYLVGWTTILDGVEVFTSTDIGLGFVWPTTIADGKQAVDLAPGLRKGGGGIQQTFSTIPGNQYDVTFDLGTALNHGKNGTGNIELAVDGITHSYSVSTQSPDWEWSPRGFSFTANDVTATLVFRSFDNPELHFASVDNVSVRAVQANGATGLYLTAALLGLCCLLFRNRT